jgi:acetyl-CoA C-acetyltransferase
LTPQKGTWYVKSEKASVYFRGGFMELRRVALVGGLRLPFMRMSTDLADLDILDMMSVTLEGVVQKYKLQGEVLGEVALGSVFFHPNYWNVARDAVLKSSLSPLTPALGLQRACATSLETAITLANKIALGQIDCGIAGGAESMSNVALFLSKPLAQRIVKFSKAKSVGAKLKVWSGLKYKDLFPASAQGFEISTGKTMGEHCEMMAKEWKIPRLAQDELSLMSHKTGIAAFDGGFYDELVMPHNGKKIDNNLRRDTSLEKLAKLKTAFDSGPEGTLTAGNSSPLTDGAACVLLASEDWAKKRGLPILAYIKDFETAAVDLRHEGLLMAPTIAMPRMLARQNLKLQDFDFYEIHEAFAAQVLCTLKAWESDGYCKRRVGLSKALGPLPRERMNIVGGSVALGHPFAATGARLLATLGKLLEQKGSGRGVISICTGGGMGTVALLERP